MEPTNPKIDIDCPSQWSNLPCDVLSTIADNIDLGVLRLRSVCSSWRSSISLSSSSIQFPLKLPFPFMSSTNSPSHIFLLQYTVYYFTPVSFPFNGYLVKVEEKERKRHNKLSLIDPLGSSSTPCIKRENRLNLLKYSVSVISKSYVFERVDDVRIPIKKVVVANDFVKDGDFVVLALCDNGILLVWRFGDDNWTEISYNRRLPFDDIIRYKGKFFATADGKGKLVMIDSRFEPIVLVHKLMYGCGVFTHLVENEGELYLVDRVRNGGLRFGVFKLDGKSRFWDYEPDLNGSVFFIGNDANFVLTKENYRGRKKDCIFFLTNDEEGLESHAEFNVKERTTCSVVDSHPFFCLYRPPKITPLRLSQRIGKLAMD